MDIFADTADIEEIKKLNDLGIIDGVTTNPTLIAKSGRDLREVLGEICDVVRGPVSGETVSTDTEGMIREGRWLREIDDTYTYETIAPSERKVIELSFYSIKANRMRGLSISADATAFIIQGKGNASCEVSTTN